MTIRCTLALSSRLLLLLAIAVVGDASRSAAQANDEAVRAYFLSLTKPGNDLDVTGAATVRATVSPAPLTAAASHAYAARNCFNEARAAMERGLLLRETAPKSNMVALETAMDCLLQQMKILATSRSGASDAVKKATALSQDWYQAGLKIIKPPAGGLLEVPFPMVVASKADAAAAALDEVVQEASGAKSPRLAGAPRRR